MTTDPTEREMAEVVRRAAAVVRRAAEVIQERGKVTASLVAERDEWKTRAENAEAVAAAMLAQFTEYADEHHAYMHSRKVGTTVVNAWRAALAPPEDGQR